MYRRADPHDNQGVITIGFYHTMQVSVLDHIPVPHLFSPFHHVQNFNQISEDEFLLHYYILKFSLMPLLENIMTALPTLNVGGNVISPSLNA